MIPSLRRGTARNVADMVARLRFRLRPGEPGRLGSLLAVPLLLLTLSANAADVSQIQECLTFAGYYDGLADGEAGPRTAAAIRAFQHALGRPDTGRLGPDETSRLYQACAEQKRRLGWAPQRLDAAGLTVDLPLGLVERREVNQQTDSMSHFLFTGTDDDPFISVLIARQATPTELDEIYRHLTSKPSLDVSYKLLKDGWFVVAGSTGEDHFYSYGRLDGERLFAYTVIWSQASDPLLGGVAIMMLNSFKQHNAAAASLAASTGGFLPHQQTAAAGRPADVQKAVRTIGPAADKLSPTEIFKKVKDSVWVLLSFNVKAGTSRPADLVLGSAVAVGPTTLFTNCHTLKGHSHHFIARAESDGVIAVDIAKADYDGDRCVLETPRHRLDSYVEIKPYAAIDVGEEAYSIGTPEGYDLTMANGIVSGKRLREGLRYLQTTASISHGSSGGGLFDSSGRLMGVTTYFIADGQNLNFAIAADAF
jgi:hypothetical protein